MATPVLMPPAEWARLRALLDEALALPAERRQRWIDTLPETAGWDDVVRVVDTASFEAAVLDGMAAADQGAFAAPAQVSALFARWGVDVAA